MVERGKLRPGESGLAGECEPHWPPANEEVSGAKASGATLESRGETALGV